MKRGFLSDSPEKTEPFTALHEWGPVDVKRAVKGSIDRIETGLQIWLLRRSAARGGLVGRIAAVPYDRRKFPWDFVRKGTARQHRTVS